MTTETRVLIFSSPNGAFDHASRTLRAACDSARDRPVAVALSGGSTPARLYDRLAAEPRAGEEEGRSTPWGRIEFFFGDERCVPPDSPGSNYRLARDGLFSRVPVAERRVHRMWGGDAHPGDPDASAREYEEEIRRRVPAGPSGLPSFDLVWLGLGADGHTASLFPGAAVLEEARRLVAPCEGPEPFPRRLTLTLPILNAARRVQFLVVGREKARAVQAILGAPEGGPLPGDLPAARVRPQHGSLEWVLDRDAASLISRDDWIAEGG